LVYNHKGTTFISIQQIDSQLFIGNLNNLSTIISDLKENELALCKLQELAATFTASGHTCKYSGLLYGKMGVVIFLLHYARQTGDTFFKNAAGKLIDVILTTINI